ncbi:MAG: T9SS type A sorting domain-containing protein [Flavobacteriales bacterium]|nr:T9SS type A sorting domain-containing protein [Flavobacteriales bacterium]
MHISLEHSTSSPLPMRLACCALFALLARCTAFAQNDGTLDPSFGIGGIVTTNMGSLDDFGFGIALQSDGRLLIAGVVGTGATTNDFGIARYTTSGLLDLSFGGTGKVVTPIGALDDQARSIAIQPNGRILVAGHAFLSSINSGTDFAIVRYMQDGSLDNSFGTGGKVTVNIALNNDAAYAIGLQDDGKIVVAGTAYLNSIYQVAVVRCLENGLLDGSFGVGGKVTFNFGSNTSLATSVSIQDGQILLGGYVYEGSDLQFALARLSENGSLDPSFGSGGKVVTSLGPGGDLSHGMVVQGDGRILLCGQTAIGGDTAIAIVRYNSTGILDSSFGNNGVVVWNVSNVSDEAWSIKTQDDGKILVAGSSGFDIAMIRLFPDGVLDNSFGTAGVVLTSYGQGSSRANAMAIQDDGQIVLCGGSQVGSGADFIVTRYKSNLASSSTHGFEIQKPLVQVFPNPNNGRFTIVLDGSAQVNTLRLFDSSGREMRVEKVMGSISTEICYELRAGHYLLEVISNHAREVHQLVVH